MPQGKRLGHAHERVIDRLVAMRVIRFHHLADHGRTLDVPAVGCHVQVGLHRVEDAPLDRLEAIADIRQALAR